LFSPIPTRPRGYKATVSLSIPQVNTVGSIVVSIVPSQVPLIIPALEDNLPKVELQISQPDFQNLSPPQIDTINVDSLPSSSANELNLENPEVVEPEESTQTAATVLVNSLSPEQVASFPTSPPIPESITESVTIPLIEQTHHQKIPISIPIITSTIAETGPSISIPVTNLESQLTKRKEPILESAKLTHNFSETLDEMLQIMLKQTFEEAQSRWMKS